VRCLAEFLYHGDQAKAATCLDIAHHTFKVHISNALARTGAVSSIQVARLLGWVEFPEGSMRHMAAR
jgi:DNA-binding CsgD family transcriptional regulator